MLFDLKTILFASLTLPFEKFGQASRFQTAAFKKTVPVAEKTFFLYQVMFGSLQLLNSAVQISLDLRDFLAYY